MVNIQMFDILRFRFYMAVIHNSNLYLRQKYSLEFQPKGLKVYNVGLYFAIFIILRNIILNLRKKIIMENETDHIEFLQLKRKWKFDSIGKDLVMLEDISAVKKNLPMHDMPAKRNVNTILLCLSGHIEVGVNLQRYTIKAPCLFMNMRDQISQYFGVSEDFKCIALAMSKKFGRQLEFSTQQTMPFLLYFKNNPSIPLTEDDTRIFYYSMRILQKVISSEENPYRTEMAKHMMQAFFYAASMALQKHISTEEKKIKTRQEEIFENFIMYVQQFYREQRGLEFYADKLAITPKHLSAVIKKASGKSPSEWIDEHVILEAKVLLKTTKMTIQQISDELGFSDQSFFGRYFKRHVGMSPKNYRESLNLPEIENS